MANGGLGDPSGRRERRLKRALSASAILPMTAFAALGSVTVLVVALMGMSPIGPVVGPSARAVTIPRMSVSLVPPVVHPPAPPRHRESVHISGPPTVVTTTIEVRPQADVLETATLDVQVAPQPKVAVAPVPAPVPALVPAPAPAPARDSRERAGDSRQRQRSNGPATESNDVDEDFIALSVFSEGRVRTGDRPDVGSGQAAGQDEPTETATARTASASKADQDSKDSKADRDTKGSNDSNDSDADNNSKNSKDCKGSKADQDKRNS